jgi:excinuclease ABC subunit A
MVVAEGTPEQVAANPESHTGHYLAPLLDGRGAKQPARMLAATAAPEARGKRTVAAKAPAKKTTTRKTTKKAAAKKAR